MKLYMIMQDIPRVLAPDLSECGPFRKADLVSEDAIHPDVLRVLKNRGVVKEYKMSGVEKPKKGATKTAETAVQEAKVQEETEKAKKTKEATEVKKKNVVQITLDVYFELDRVLRRSRWRV